MKKNEMIKSISAKIEGMTQKDVDAVLSAYAEVVVETLAANRDEKITLPNLGTFKVKHVAERSGVATLGGDKPWTKPAHDEITFKISGAIKELA